MTEEIKVGSKVRSFDFEGRELEGERACYMEGLVTAIVEHEGCLRYVVRVERIVFGGKELTNSPGLGGKIYPPVNHTPTIFGRPTGGVELI